MSFVRPIFFSVFALFFAAVSGAVPVAGAATLAGSDLLKGSCAKALTTTTKEVPGVEKLVLDGSLMAEKQLREGRTDAALLLLPKDKKVPEIVRGEWEALPVAFQTVVVVVNRLNPIDQINQPTLAGIFGTGQTAVRHWRNGWPSPLNKDALNFSIYPVSTRHDLGMVTPIFRSSVLDGNPFNDSVGFRNSDAETMAVVADTTHAIGLLAVPPTPKQMEFSNGQIKVLSLVAPKTGSTYLPTPENLNNGDYPLSVPLYFVFPKKRAAEARPLFRAVFGDALAQAMPEAGFVAMPKNLRDNFVRQLEAAK